MTDKLDNFGADAKPILTQPDDLNYQDSILTLQDSSLFGEKKKEMRKNGVTCLRKNPSRYEDLNKALDYLFEDSSYS